MTERSGSMFGWILAGTILMGLAPGCVKSTGSGADESRARRATEEAKTAPAASVDRETVRPTLTPEEHADICAIEQPFPYGVGSPYVGLHANRENNNRVYCPAGDRYERAWNDRPVLQGYMVFQPISFAPDRTRLYVAVARSTGCKLFAIDAGTGDVVWCKGKEGGPEALTIGVSAGTAEVDLDGNVYVTDGLERPEHTAVYSWTPEGKLRWRTPLGSIHGAVESAYLAPAGLHFTPDGYVATVTPGGVVVLLSRETGEIVATFDIPGETGFVPPRPKEGPNLARLPRGLRAKLERVLGAMSPEELGVFMGASKGASGAFSDNTIGISKNNQVFVVGGGPTPDDGSLVALDVGHEGDGVKLTLRWYMVIRSGSATSPAISREGDRVVVGDGAGNIVYARIDRCNENTDADARPEVCAAAWTYPLLGKPLLGSAALDENGVVYCWNSSKDPAATDLFALRDTEAGPEVVWETTFTDREGYNLQWTSAATVLDNQVVGTVTTIRRAVEVDGNPLMLNLSHEVVGVERATGRVAWRLPIPDDSINSPAVGPDGSLYVPLLGILDLTSPNRKVGYSGGIVKYRPVYYRD